MAGDAPAERRVLAIRSMETKLVMHWTRGDCCRRVERWAQAVVGQLEGFFSNLLSLL